MPKKDEDFSVEFSKKLRKKLSPVQAKMIEQLAFAFGNLADPNATLFRVLNTAWGMTNPLSYNENKGNGPIVQSLTTYNRVRAADNAKSRSRAKRRAGKRPAESP